MKSKSTGQQKTHRHQSRVTSVNFIGNFALVNFYIAYKMEEKSIILGSK